MKLNVIKKIQENGKVSYYSIIQNEFNGKKTTYFLSIGFKRGTEPENTCTIDIKTMFFSCFPSGNSSKLKLMVGEYELLKEDTTPAIQEYNQAVGNSEDLGF